MKEKIIAKKKIAISAVAILILLMSCALCEVLQCFNDTDYTITVTDKERVYSSRRKISKYLIFAEDKDKNFLVFENTDCLFREKWNSSNIQGKLKKGHVYNITVVGFRIPILSMYQNIIEVKEIQE